MDNETRMVRLPMEEYRELALAKRDAERLKTLLRQKLERFGGISHEELELLCAVFAGPEDRSGETNGGRR